MGGGGKAPVWGTRFMPPAGLWVSDNFSPCPLTSSLGCGVSEPQKSGGARDNKVTGIAPHSGPIPCPFPNDSPPPRHSSRPPGTTVG